jgi:hypothetical protein
MMSIEDLEAQLRANDDATRHDRAERLDLLVQEMGEGDYRMFPGGPISAWAFQEATRAYVDGQYLSCVVVSQVCLEHSLAGTFALIGHDGPDGENYRNLLRQAHTVSALTDPEFELFDRLRTQRNPYAHPRPLADKASLLQRAVSSGTAVDDILMDDARQAVTALIRFTNRGLFMTQPPEHKRW